MAFDIRLPNITGSTEREQLAQVKSYLYQLTEQLQWAINNVGSAPANYVVSQTPRSGASSSGSSSFDVEVAFADLKPLIIKSADIVYAYYEEISERLKGEYVAVSDFGTFKQDTERIIKETSTYSEDIYKNVQEISTDIENLDKTLIEVNAHIRSGLLDEEDGTPIYGLEIGQRNKEDGEETFNKFARFTSDRLSFYDQSNQEVAYISDYKLYIRNAEITQTLKMGGFVDTVMSTKDVVTKWVGGDE